MSKYVSKINNGTEDLIIKDRTGELIHYVKSVAGTAGKKNVRRTIWTGVVDNITELYTGLTVSIKAPLAGVNVGVTLNINSLGEHPVVFFANTIVETHFPVGSIIILTYDSEQSATVTIDSVATTIMGCWKLSNYDSNSDVLLRLYKQLDSASWNYDFPLIAGRILSSSIAETDSKYAATYGLIGSNNVTPTLNPITGEVKIKSLTLDGKSPLIQYQEITYSNIVTLYNNSQLIPGQWYRITDYVTTTVQADTQSAGHQFDIIVVADSANKLNENARAIQHAGDTYFANSKLEAWELKYCIDNDTNRFAWADTTNGKGVIYWMKDEYNNQLPFDFKNIQFKRYKITATSQTINGQKVLAQLKDTYLGFRLLVQSGTGSLYPLNCTISTSDTQWSFALSVNGAQDLTLQTNHHCTDNVVEPCFFNNKQYLNNVTLQATSASANNYNNCIDGTSHSISLGNGCYNNTFIKNSYTCTLSSYCHDNTLSNSSYNTLSNSSYNALSSYCYYNTISYNSYNILSSNCNYNTLLNSGRNTLSSGCEHNILSLSNDNTISGSNTNTLSDSNTNTLSDSNTNTLSGSSDNTLSSSNNNTLSDSNTNTLSGSSDNTLSSNFYAELIGCYSAVVPEGFVYEQGIGGYMVYDGLYIKNYGQRRTINVFLAEYGSEDYPDINETITLEAGQVYYVADTYFTPSENSLMTFTEGGKTHTYGFNLY